MSEKIAVVRHADYHQGGYGAKETITEEGRQQTLETAKLLKEFLGEEFCRAGVGLVISSQAKRAIQTANIIADELGLLRISHPCLGDGKDISYTGKYIVKQLENFLHPLGGYQALVLVAHAEQVSNLPQYLDPKINGNVSDLYYSWAYALEPQAPKTKNWRISVLYKSEG